MNVMVDIETLGTKKESAILSIGAVAFDTHGIHHEFYTNISIKNNLINNRKIDGDTLNWWFSQSDDVIKSIIKEPCVNLCDALLNFRNWLEKMRFHTIWANGANFDIEILQNAYEQFNIDLPWKYKQICCMRAIRELGRIISLPYGQYKSENIFLAHNALEDATIQAQYVNLIFNKVISYQEQFNILDEAHN